MSDVTLMLPGTLYRQDPGSWRGLGEYSPLLTVSVLPGFNPLRSGRRGKSRYSWFSCCSILIILNQILTLQWHFSISVINAPSPVPLELPLFRWQYRSGTAV